MNKKQMVSVAICIVIVCLVLWRVGTRTPEQPESVPETVVLPKPAPATPEDQQAPPGKLIGEKLLRAYGTEATTLRDDLEAVHRVSLSYVTLVKTHADVPIGGNADLADALRGKNPYQQRFLPEKHPAFNDDGEIVDRWDTPLFIHTVSAGRWEIRSAGPDRRLWTEDDLQLLPNGKFIEGTPDTTLYHRKPILPTGR